MTTFDILVPIIALAVAGVGILVVRWTDPDRRAHKRHAAE